MHIEIFFEILGACLQILNVAVIKDGFDRLEKKIVDIKTNLDDIKSDVTNINTDIVKLKND